MYESREAYGNIVSGQLRILELIFRHRIHHGDTWTCPRCGADGMFDIAGPGFDPYLENSIYYSTVFNEWRCRICDFRMCS